MSWDPETETATWRSAPLDHRVENLTTARLERRCGPPSATPASVVVKALQPASAHPAFAEIPEQFHQQVLEDLHWLAEPGVYRSGLGEALPSPLRMPVVHAVTGDGEERCSLWLEDVRDVVPWDIGRYQRTAEALGALAGTWDGPTAEARFGLGHRDIGRLFFGKVLNHDLPAQHDDAFWSDDVVAELVDAEHRRDLLRLADAVPGLLRSMTGAPLGVCHGDASPANFLEPGDGSVVAIDWSYGHVGDVGTDLAQLLAGRFESGVADPGDVERIAEAVVGGFLQGLDRAGREVDPSDVRRAFALHLAVRSAFSLLRVDHVPDLDDDGRRALLRPRARLGRFAIDLALSFA